MPRLPHTPQRNALVRRALYEALTIRVNPSAPYIAHVSSTYRPGRFFRVTRTSCTCFTFQHQGICKHQAVCCYLADAGLPPFISNEQDIHDEYC